MKSVVFLKATDLIDDARIQVEVGAFLNVKLDVIHRHVHVRTAFDQFHLFIIEHRGRGVNPKQKKSYSAAASPTKG